jgi:cytochrome c oxidase assembly protein subunit 15
MSLFGRFAILTTMLTYFLIFMGGLVRVSGAGLGCPDWPKCFGRWIPPVTISQIPPDIDPGAFNFTLAWIEYINRLFGMTLGLLIAAMAIWALIRYRSERRIVIPAVIAALLTAYQGWQGSQVVSSGLEPVIVSAHMVIALVIAGLMIYISINAYYRDREKPEAEYAKSAGLFASILLVVVLGQIVFGIQLREAIERVFSEFPLISSMQALFHSGWVLHAHAFIGIIVLILAIVTSNKLLSRLPSPLVWQSAWTLSGLAVLQLVLGAILYLAGIPAVARLLHMWVSALLFGVILIAHFSLSRERRIV